MGELLKRNVRRSDSYSRNHANHSDEIEYGLFILPSAFIALSVSSIAPTWRMQFLGNRQGMASLASVCLWLGANAYRREFLSLTALPFIKSVSDVAVMVRVSAAEGTGRFGLVRRLNGASEVEWELSEEELQRLALRLHYLASVPEHEYELLEVGPAAQIEIRLSDARTYV